MYFSKFNHIIIKLKFILSSLDSHNEIMYSIQNIIINLYSNIIRKL